MLGGLGSLSGAVIASLVMGVGEAVLAVEISPTWSSSAFFVILILVLLIRPQGLLGTEERGGCEPGDAARAGPRRRSIARCFLVFPYVFRRRT